MENSDLMDIYFDNICMKGQRQKTPDPSSTPVEDDRQQHSILHGLVVDPFILIDVVGTHSAFYNNKYKRISIPAPREPYALPDPKNGTGFDNALTERHKIVKPIIEAALEFFKRDYDEKYCEDRYVVRQVEIPVPPDSDFIGKHADAIDGEMCSIFISVGEPDIKAYCKQLRQQLDFQTGMRAISGTVYELYYSDNTADHVTDVYNVVVANNDQEWKTIAFPDVGAYVIPPMSSFLLGSFNETFQAFDVYSKSASPRGFDLIVMDPPWPNRSVGRAKAYEMFNPHDLFKLKRHHFRRGGVLAVWVTNKTKWIDLVINKLFPSLGLEYVAKWIWLKVTENGEPIFNLESVSRKPYEILLLGKPKQGSRRQKDGTLPLEEKVLVGVPELHSRKPCLKDIIYPYISNNPRVCEIFARNLVEGWFSWGDEVMKGNHVQNWHKST